MNGSPSYLRMCPSAVNPVSLRRQQEWTLKLAQEYGISDRVFVNGPIGDEKLRQELKQAHLAIMPSHAESFGLSIAEAQAAGIPDVSRPDG